MQQQISDELLLALDRICAHAYGQGMDPKLIAGTLLARSEHWYLTQNEHDIDGLIKLLNYALKPLESRPKFIV
jgi:hypothetical protein